MKTTIFTPTYNRSHLLPALFESLCHQTCMDFEWVVVDDGSTDNTEQIVRGWINKAQFPIVYEKQKNGGKHRAINRGVELAQGELFFIVDSDDNLPNDAIMSLHEEYEEIKDDKTFAGVCGLKCYSNGNIVCGGLASETLDCTYIEFRYNLRVVGDMAEVFRTDLMRQFPFPEIDKEVFCPEALIWNRIGSRYKVRFFNRNIYFCEYLPDGLTAKITRIRMRSPMACMIYYSELSQYDIPIKDKIKAHINFWRFAACSPMTFGKKIKMTGCLSIPMMPIGLLMHHIDKKKSIN